MLEVLSMDKGLSEKMRPLHRHEFIPEGANPHAWLCRSSQEPVAGEVTGPRAEPTTVVLLNGRLSDCLLNTSIHTPRSVSFSAFIRAHAGKV